MQKTFKGRKHAKRVKGREKGYCTLSTRSVLMSRYFTGQDITVQYVTHLALETESDSIPSKVYYYFVRMNSTFAEV